VGSGSSLLSCAVFLPLPLSQAFPLLVAGRAPSLRQRLSSQAGLFIYSPGKGSLPPIFSAQCAPPSFLRVFIALIAYYSVSLFSPGVEVRGLCCSGPGLSVGVLRTMKLTWSASSQAFWVPATGDPGALLVSPFNVEWRFSALVLVRSRKKRKDCWSGSSGRVPV
jgi:hypothetical protein